MKTKISLLSFLILLIGLAVYSYQNLPTTLPTTKEEKSDVVVYQSKTCGCCKKWVKHLAENGFKVKSVLVDDMSEIKNHLGIPHKLSSCHTATIDGYLVEGHVPATAIKKMLKERSNVKGISVPGMPIGSPGMEANYVESYDVVSFMDDGTQNIFARY